MRSQKGLLRRDRVTSRGIEPGGSGGGGAGGGTGGAGGGTGGAGGGATTVTPDAALFQMTSFPADGDASGVGHIDPHFGGKTLDAAATLTLTVTLTGTGAGTETVDVALTNGMTAAQAGAAIIAAWNGVAGLSVAPASAGTGTFVDITPASGTQVTAVAPAVT